VDREGSLEDEERLEAGLAALLAGDDAPLGSKEAVGLAGPAQDKAAPIGGEALRGSQETTDLLALAAEVRRSLASSPSPEAHARHVRNLLERARHVPASARPAARTRRGRILRSPVHVSRRAALVTAGTVLGLMLSGSAAVAASQSALPGQPLYGVKTATENVRLAFERAPSERARLHVEFALRRLEEAGKLASRGEANRAAAAAQASSREWAQAQAEAGRAAAGQRPDLEAHLAEVAAHQVDTLTAVLDKLPETASEEARDAIIRARDRAQERATNGVGKGKQGVGPKDRSGTGQTEGTDDLTDISEESADSRGNGESAGHPGRSRR